MTHTVLLIDDSEVHRSVLERQLGEAGFAVATADGGLSGLAGARAILPDVVVLDLMMPDVDGHEVLLRLRDDAALTRVPVIMLTQQETGADAARLLLAGADDYVRKPYALTELIARINVAIGKAAAMAALRDTNGRLLVEARVDPLSGLPNRRSIELELNRLVAAATRRHRALTVVMVDVDNFKAVNDQDGHAAGDRALQAVAQAISSALRSEDLAGRWAGDEFIAVLPDTDGPGAEVVAERIRSEIEATCLVTASVGWATWAGDEESGPLVARADRALYDAKAAGRNVARFADPPQAR